MSAMRPGLPDPLLQLLGASWSMGAPVVGAAWAGPHNVVGFGLADGSVAVARAEWDGAACLRPREAGGVELVPASGPPPPVMRASAHAGPCLSIQSDPAGAIFSGGADGGLTRTQPDGHVETLAGFSGTRVSLIAAGPGGALACATGRQIHCFGSEPAILDLPSEATALAFDPTGHVLAIGLADGVTLWAGQGATSQELICPGPHRAIAWSEDGRYIASGAEPAGLHAWRVADGVAIALDDTRAGAVSLSFSGPGAFLATGGGGRVACWDLGRGTRGECGIGSTAPVVMVACHPRRTLIAAGYENGAVLLVQPDSADIVFVRGAGGGPTNALAWSADGSFLALATANGEIGVVGFPDLLFRAAPGVQPEAVR